MSLWSNPVNPNDPKENPFKDLKLEDISAEELERSWKERQEHCSHKMMRFGPSYTLRYDGSYKKFDESICMKCGYNL